MPAKKQPAKKKVRKPQAKKAAARKPSKPSPKKKKTIPAIAAPRRVEKPQEIRPLEVKEAELPVQQDDSAKIECEHCLGAGKCTAGEPYDKGHHQVFGSKVMMTSCFECLESSGEHRNSKKLVACRVCGGSGMVNA
jgi:hypothetical protein